MMAQTEADGPPIKGSQGRFLAAGRRLSTRSRCTTLMQLHLIWNQPLHARVVENHEQELEQ